MSKKNTIFSPSKPNRMSFSTELQTLYFSTIQSQFPQLATLPSLLSKNPYKRLYQLLMQNRLNHQYKQAIFFGDKLLTLTKQHIGVIYLLGQCYYYNGDFKRVHSLFLKYRVVAYNISFQILAAKALLSNKQYQQCLNVLDLQLQNQYFNRKLQALRFFIRAQCAEASQNKILAVQMYFQCLKKDPSSVQAFNRLIDSCLISTNQKQQLLTMLNFNSQDLWIKYYYVAKIRDDQLQDKIAEQQIRVDNLFQTLQLRNNIDILCIKAKNAFDKYDTAKAYQICLQAIKEDPLYFDIIPIYCSSLLDQEHLGQLYYCAHNLVQNYSNQALSWFAVGTYYFLTKKYQIARKFFQKSIVIDRNFIYSWIGMGHSFAIQDESDQAMSIYRTISRLFPGCYQAHLYMGMQYLRTNNLKTAVLSFQHAKQINSNDPLIYNQIGVIYYKQKMYSESKQMYTQALSAADSATPWIIQTILSNLAHCYRKLKDYKNSTKYFQKCVTLNPQNGQTYFSLAFTYHLWNQLNKAICYYHKSLKCRRDNQFAQDMLSKALSDASDLPWQTVYNI